MFKKRSILIALLPLLLVPAVGLWRMLPMVEEHYLTRCASYGLTVPHEERTECGPVLVLIKARCLFGNDATCGHLGVILNRGIVFGEARVASAEHYLRKGCRGGYAPACRELNGMKAE